MVWGAGDADLQAIRFPMNVFYKQAVCMLHAATR
jgi:hypothetical protein